jgi:non-ribosomal peptide synthetase component E (peptide arylation enzyme)
MASTLTPAAHDAPWSWLAPPAAHHRRYAAGGFWPERTVGDLAREWAEREPDAIVFPGDAAAPTYASLAADAEALAVSLGDLGLARGDVVSFQTPNWIEACVINLAAALGGFVINPIVSIYRDAEVRQMLGDCGARVFFHAESFRGYDFAAMVERIRPDLPALQHAIAIRPGAGGGYAALVEAGRGRSLQTGRIDPGTVKMILYTSGTTGRPKGVLHSHNSLARAAGAGAEHWGIEAGDALLMPSPVTHVSGYSNGLELPFLAGTRTVLMESWNALEAHRSRHALPPGTRHPRKRSRHDAAEHALFRLRRGGGAARNRAKRQRPVRQAGRLPRVRQLGGAARDPRLPQGRRACRHDRRRDHRL